MVLLYSVNYIDGIPVAMSYVAVLSGTKSFQLTHTQSVFLALWQRTHHLYEFVYFTPVTADNLTDTSQTM